MAETEIETNLEEELENEERHFQTTHRLCSLTRAPGTLVIADCGALFRLKGNFSLLPTSDNCAKCEALFPAPCAVCGGGFDG